MTDPTIRARIRCDKEGCDKELPVTKMIIVSPPDALHRRFCCYAHLYDWARERMYEESGLEG